MHHTMRSYIVPFVLAVLVHALVVAALWANWTPDTEVQRVIKPRIVQAELIVMQPKPKPVPPKPQAAPPQPKPEVKPQPKPEVKPQPKKPEPPKPDLAAQKRAEEAARRTAELQRLAATSFTDALDREAVTLSEDDNEEVAMSFAQGIYQLIVANWSRPPSARNGMQAQLIVELVPTGDVVGVTLVKGSGNEAFDRSAEQAIRKAGKFEVPKEPEVFEAYFRRLPVLFKPEDLLR